jgi:transposase
MHVTIPKARGPSITLISSLSAKRGIIHSEVFSGSNKKETFKRFISHLKAKCQGLYVVVIMDNLSVHNAKIVEEEFERHFEKRLLPTYSCALNPIERIWRVVKQTWRKTVHLYCMQQDSVEDRLQAARQRILQIVESIE